MQSVEQSQIDALLIFPPLYSERAAGLVAEELISDAKHPFEHPQGVLSIASYARSSDGGKQSFDVRVIPLDAHLCRFRREDDGAPRWYLPEGTDVEAEACRIAEDAVARLKPRVIGISVPYYLAEPIALTLAKHLRACVGEDVPIILGGQEISFYDTRFPGEAEFASNSLLAKHPEVDAIVRKEGEFTFQRLLERVSAGESFEGTLGLTHRQRNRVVVEADRPRGNLADIPALDYSALFLPHDVTIADFLQATNISLVFMRGCTHGRCSFCTSLSWFGALSTLSESDEHGLARFLDNCRKTLRSILACGVREVQILDETINCSQGYFDGLCHVLEDLQREFSAGLQQKLPLSILAETRVDRVNEPDLVRMRAVGVTLLYLGLETGSPTVLAWMNKRLGTPLLADASLVSEVSEFCGEDVLQRFPAEVAQAVCACYLVKKHELRLGTFFMVGHPGSSPAEEERSFDLLEFLFDKGLLTSVDVVEAGIFMPLNGTAARNFPQVRLHVQDKRLWGRMSGHAVCDLVEQTDDGETVIFSREEIEAAFRRISDLVLTRQGKVPTKGDTPSAGRSRWGAP